MHDFGGGGGGAQHFQGGGVDLSDLFSQMGGGMGGGMGGSGPDIFSMFMGGGGGGGGRTRGRQAGSNPFSSQGFSFQFN